MQAHSISIRIVLATALVCVSLLAAPGIATARAGTNAETIAESLISYDGLYIATTGGRLDTDIAMDQLRKAQQGVKLPVYVMVLSAKDAPTDAAAQDKLLGDVAGFVGRTGTYVLFAGSTLRVHSTAFAPATIEKLTAQARKSGGKDPIMLLAALIKAAGNTPQETSAPGPHAAGGRYVPPVTKDKDGSGTSTVLIIAGVAVILLAGAGAVLFVRRKRSTAAGAPVTAAETTDGTLRDTAKSAGTAEQSVAEPGKVTASDRPAASETSPENPEEPV